MKSNQSRRKLNLFLVLLVVWVLVFQFTTIKPAKASSQINLKILVYAKGAALLQPYIKQFEEIHPNIAVNIIEGPHASDAIEDLYTASFILGNTPYDLVYIDSTWVAKFAAAGWLLDLSDRISSSDLDRFVKIEVEAGKYGGKLYRVPFLSGSAMLFYRQDLLEAAGYQPPKTFEDLITTAIAVQKQGSIDWGYAWQGKQYEGMAAMFVEVLTGYGGFWIDPETETVGLDRPEAIAAVEFLRRAIASGISPPGVTTYTEDESRRLFEAGKVLFLRNWSYVYNLAANSSVGGKFGIEPMVTISGEKGVSCAGGWGLAIAKTSAHPDAAWELIEFLTSDRTQRDYILNTGYQPSLKSVFSDPQVVAKYNYYPQLLAIADRSVLRPVISQYSQASDILQRYLSAAIANKMSPEIAMEKAAAETRRLLQNKF